MEGGRFTVNYPDGTVADFPLLVAEVSIGEANGQWWLSVQASTTPPDGSCPRDGDIPEFPAIDASARIVGPELSAWTGLEFSLSAEHDPRTGCYPAWLYTTGGYDALVECVVSVGERVGSRVAIRVVGRTSSPWCSIRVVGAFTLVIGSAQEAE
jgi:hypothetical protein